MSHSETSGEALARAWIEAHSELRTLQGDAAWCDLDESEIARAGLLLMRRRQIAEMIVMEPHLVALFDQNAVLSHLADSLAANDEEFIANWRRSRTMLDKLVEGLPPAPADTTAAKSPIADYVRLALQSMAAAPPPLLQKPRGVKWLLLLRPYLDPPGRRGRAFVAVLLLIGLLIAAGQVLLLFKPDIMAFLTSAHRPHS
jgi:hypothetical protein